MCGQGLAGLAVVCGQGLATAAVAVASKKNLLCISLSISCRLWFGLV